jgi:hypothetical protein
VASTAAYWEFGQRLNGSNNGEDLMEGNKLARRRGIDGWKQQGLKKMREREASKGILENIKIHLNSKFHFFLIKSV